MSGPSSFSFAAGMSQKLAPGLRQNLTQSLVMTPQLVQAIKLLQMSHLELSRHVEDELERNPLLERESDRDTDDAGTAAETEDWHARELTETNTDLSGPPDSDYSNLYQDDNEKALTPSQESPYDRALEGPSMLGAAIGEDMAFDATLAGTTSLRTRLEDQLFLMTTNPILRALCQYLVSQLDGAGYLQLDIGAVCDQFSIDEATLEAAIALIHGCEPAGIGARNLQECLELQLLDQGVLDDEMRLILDNLPLLAQQDIAALQNLTGLTDRELSNKISSIRSLNPKPGEMFEALEPESLVPDVLVKPNSTEGSDSAWLIELNSDVLPRLLVNEVYYQTVSKHAKEEEKSFVNTSLQSASGLIKALDQRARSILKVATEIVRIQDAFFLHGIEYLKPMTLKQVADAIEMHESTVSRVTSNKYISTPRGIFEMKFFFSSSIAGVNGEVHSGEAVRHRIKQLIEQEVAGSILSDDALVEKLKAFGIDIARRTVAKYREALGIPSSVARRRQKRAAGGQAR